MGLYRNCGYFGLHCTNFGRNNWRANFQICFQKQLKTNIAFFYNDFKGRVIPSFIFG